MSFPQAAYLGGLEGKATSQLEPQSTQSRSQSRKGKSGCLSITRLA